MKIFISGPMRNKPNGNKEAFFEAEYKLKRLGYSVFNPAWCQYGYNTEFTEDDMHMIDFSALSRCDAIYMLKGWQYSKGAKAEYDHAKILCKAILREGDPITDPLICDKYDWESWKKKLPDRLDNHADRIDTLDNHADRIDTLEDEVEAIKESIGTDNLQEQLEKDFADVYEEFQTTKDKVNDIEFGYIDWSSKMSSAIDEIEKVKDSVSDIRRIVNSSDIKNISVKAMNDRMNFFGRELDSLSTAIDIKGKDIESIIQKRCDDNRTINNMLNDINIRLKAIEKRLDIKPFYAPTEDEKDD